MNSSIETMASNLSITRIFKQSAYAPDVIDEVFPVVYDEMRRLASHLLKQERPDHTLGGTELVHEAYMRLIGLSEVSYNDRRHFFATAAMAMRRILIDHERKRRADKRIPPGELIALDFSFARDDARAPIDLLALDDALRRLETLSTRQARAIELSFFAGLNERQIADVLEVSRPTVARDLRAAKLWLRREMRP